MCLGWVELWNITLMHIQYISYKNKDTIKSWQTRWLQMSFFRISCSFSWGIRKVFLKFVLCSWYTVCVTFIPMNETFILHFLSLHWYWIEVLQSCFPALYFFSKLFFLACLGPLQTRKKSWSHSHINLGCLDLVIAFLLSVNTSVLLLLTCVWIYTGRTCCNCSWEVKLGYIEILTILFHLGRNILYMYVYVYMESEEKVCAPWVIQCVLHWIL